ncbi:hypothetical protein ACLESD_31115 [Pyxidicoccus sp. 3LFB2]
MPTLKMPGDAKKAPNAAPNAEGAAQAATGAGGFDIGSGLMGLAGTVLQLGYKDIADWIKAWAQAATTYSNVSDVVARPGERLVFVFHGADDEATIVFNGERVASKNLGERATTHVSMHAVKPGLNMLIVAVDNRGYFDWGVFVDVYEERSRRFLTRFLFKGNDGFFGNMHMFSCRVWGR